jgi:uncharacterized protein (TIGR02246 family)
MVARVPAAELAEDRVCGVSPHDTETRRFEAMNDSSMEDVLAEWKTAFDLHRTDVMASLFAPDALFQGFGPTVISGREAIRDYYDAVPDNRSADVTILHTYTIGEEMSGGFADVTFSDPAGWEARVHLSLVLQRVKGKWSIRQYHVSQVMSGH